MNIFLAFITVTNHAKKVIVIVTTEDTVRSNVVAIRNYVRLSLKDVNVIHIVILQHVLVLQKVENVILICVKVI